MRTDTSGMMFNYFCAWKRKAGLVTLGIACTMVGLWVHSEFYVDIVYAGRLELASLRGGLYLMSHSERTFTASEFNSNSATPDKANDPWRQESFQRNWALRFGGFRSAMI